MSSDVARRLYKSFGVKGLIDITVIRPLLFLRLLTTITTLSRQICPGMCEEGVSDEMYRHISKQ
jgi:hypothetical protein